MVRDSVHTIAADTFDDVEHDIAVPSAAATGGPENKPSTVSRGRWTISRMRCP